VSDIRRAGDFNGRRAAYAPISALEKFFQVIGDRAVPERVDHRFLQKLNVATNNEYSLLSALKFLDVVDDRGIPTHSYRLLQTTDRFQDTLSHLVHIAYRPVFEAGAERLPDEDLVNFFRLSSSASQARNAARFFRAVCTLAGGVGAVERDTSSMTDGDQQPGVTQPSLPAEEAAADTVALVLRARVRLLEKLPPYNQRWSLEEYERVLSRFLELAQYLDPNDVASALRTATHTALNTGEDQQWAP